MLTQSRTRRISRRHTSNSEVHPKWTDRVKIDTLLFIYKHDLLYISVNTSIFIHHISYPHCIMLWQTLSLNIWLYLSEMEEKGDWRREFNSKTFAERRILSSRISSVVRTFFGFFISWRAFTPCCSRSPSLCLWGRPTMHMWTPNRHSLAWTQPRNIFVGLEKLVKIS